MGDRWSVPATLTSVQSRGWSEIVTGSGLGSIGDIIDESGVVVVRFDADSSGPAVTPSVLDRWIASRAVTVADIEAAVAGSALEMALCCDLVYMRPAGRLELPEPSRVPGLGLIWAAGRAGRRALARVLLDPLAVEPEEAVELGLADGVVAADAPIPMPLRASWAALSAARDLMRSGATGEAARSLELATFRWLFATGDPEEGARAFLEKRESVFAERRPMGREARPETSNDS